MFRSKLLVASAMIAFASASSQATAAIQVTLSAGGLSTTIVDGGAGDFDGVVNNSIGIISQTVGAYSFDFLLTTTNTPGGGGLAFVNQGTNQITGAGATTVGIYASADGFTSPVSPPNVRADSGSTFQFLQPTLNGNVADHSYRAFVDDGVGNSVSTSAAGQTASAQLVGSGAAAGLTAPGGNSSLLDQRVQAIASPYTLNLELTAVLQSAGMNTIDLDGTLQLAPVPEPGTFAIWSLLGLATCVGGVLRNTWLQSQRS